MISVPADYSALSRDFAGKVVLVTGAGSGLGCATARQLAALGATVVLAGRKLKSLEAVYDEIIADGHAEPVIYPVNLAAAAWTDYAELAAQIGEQFDRLDGLVHCAAHFSTFSSMDSVEPGDWQLAMQTNLIAPWAISRACLPLLGAAPDRGSVVFIGDQCRAFYGPYGVSKEALAAAVKAWTAEQSAPPYPRMNLYFPGPMRTPLRHRGFPGETPETAALPQSRVAAILWLLSPDSAQITGQQVSA